MKKNQKILCSFFLLVLILAVSNVVVATPPPLEYKFVTVHDLTINSNAYVSQKIQVSGKLINKGDYYLNPAFFITDAASEFAVNAWVPLEVTNPPSGSYQPTTMQTYLDKTVTLQGTVVFQQSLYQLQVSSASIRSAEQVSVPAQSSTFSNADVITVSPTQITVEQTNNGPEPQNVSVGPEEQGVGPVKVDVCPANCVCNGDIISCSTGESPKLMKVYVETTSGVEPVTIKNANGAVFLNTTSASAETTSKLVIQKSKLFMETSSGQQQIKIMPAAAVSSASGSGKTQKVILTEDNAKPVYYVTKMNTAKILFLFPVLVTTESHINAQTGQTISVSKPWWNFLAW